ncbi:MAG: hypothetical protein HKM07_03090 [Chlamydiae bacterium]|nr:hypothetical protein [Chlamydiota bacterium]
MDKEEPPKKKNFREEAIKKEARKLKARSKKEVNPWWGFSLFGLVGWAVVIPVLIGIFVGMFLDHRYAGHSWTISLLLAGICVGVILAFYLLARELFKNKDE